MCYAVDFEVSTSIYRHSMQLVLAGIGTIIKTRHEIVLVQRVRNFYYFMLYK